MAIPENPIRESESTLEEYSLFAVMNLLLRRRRLVGGFAAAGAVLGLLSGLLSDRLYGSRLTILPQVTESNLLGLARAAGALGVRLPSATSGGWDSPIYVEVLQSQALLGDIALDSVVVVEEGGRRVALSSLFKVPPTGRGSLKDRAVLALRKVIATRELKALNAVQVTVTTRWPSVSYAVAQRLLDAVGRFAVETRQSQATAERNFIEARVADAKDSLRGAENRLQTFLQRNRSTANSPELEFDRDRLQREVGLRQQLYATLLESYQEARIREVRDTPVFTVLEAPQVPTVPRPRRSVLKAGLGLLAGSLLGFLISFVSVGLAGARRRQDSDSREFFGIIDQITPRILKRRAR